MTAVAAAVELLILIHRFFLISSFIKYDDKEADWFDFIDLVQSCLYALPSTIIVLFFWNGSFYDG